MQSVLTTYRELGEVTSLLPSAPHIPLSRAPEKREDPASQPCRGGALTLEGHPTEGEENLKPGGAWLRESGTDSHAWGSPYADMGLSSL